jgi:hypothetical protein
MRAEDRRAQVHDCPGCEAPGVPQHQLSCKPCWFRLPSPLRNAVNGAYRQRATNPTAHRAALGAAMRWYRENPA